MENVTKNTPKTGDSFTTSKYNIRYPIYKRSSRKTTQKALRIVNLTKPGNTVNKKVNQSIWKQMRQMILRILQIIMFYNYLV